MIFKFYMPNPFIEYVKELDFYYIADRNIFYVDVRFGNKLFEESVKEGRLKFIIEDFVSPIKSLLLKAHEENNKDFFEGFQDLISTEMVRTLYLTEISVQSCLYELFSFFRDLEIPKEIQLIYPEVFV